MKLPKVGAFDIIVQDIMAIVRRIVHAAGRTLPDAFARIGRIDARPTVAGYPSVRGPIQATTRVHADPESNLRLCEYLPP